MNASPPPGYLPPPPPPPPAAASPWKWILIGCGSVAALIVLVCAGFSIWGYTIAASLMAQTEEAKVTLETHADVAARLGKVTSVTPEVRQTQNADQTIIKYFQVKGATASATAEHVIKMTGVGKFESVSLTLVLADGTRVPLPAPKKR